ncbi:hypothetical protein DERF_013362 [Dermatophagoides farinae]|uniref:Uncharacterized protein n=1 Tax=Dermatophagoides farinae TaxID=6954 RepID=A0A922HM06_DERFA|nr:hypothetical protein DERF_013362 [Dermatophagoides farinae]
MLNRQMTGKFEKELVSNEKYMHNTHATPSKTRTQLLFWSLLHSAILLSSHQIIKIITWKEDKFLIAYLFLY